MEPGSYRTAGVGDRALRLLVHLVRRSNADNRSFPEARVDLGTGAKERVTEKAYDADLPGSGPRAR